MGGFCLVVEPHWGGSATDGATLSTFCFVFPKCFLRDFHAVCAIPGFLNGTDWRQK